LSNLYLFTLFKRNKFLIYLIIFVLLIGISLNKNILTIIETNLENHMIIEHALFFLIGIISVILVEQGLKYLLSKENFTIAMEKRNSLINNKKSYPLSLRIWMKIVREIYSIRPKFIWILFLIYFLIFWHIPFIFDAASSNDYIHILQHISFIASGSFIFIAMRVFGEVFNILLIFSIIGMMGLAGILFTVLDNPIFYFYSLDSHRNTGNYMLILSMILGIILLPFYLIKKSFEHIKIRINSNTEDNHNNNNNNSF
jgi:hypothetical protein